MKTVSGIVLSSKPISLSKATSTFSSFISSDTGASRVFGVYLRRTLTSFRELKQLHRELKAPRPHHRQSRHRSESQNDVTEAVGENPSRSVVLTEEVTHGLESKPKPNGKEKKGGVRNFGEVGGEVTERVSEEIHDKKTKRAKRGNVGNSDDNGGRIEKGDGEKREAEESVEMHSKKKQKTKDNVGNSDENGGHIEKRADEGVEKREAAHSPEVHSKKKKKKDNVGNSDENGGHIEKRADEGVEKREAADSPEVHSKKKKNKKKDNVSNSDENAVQIEKGDDEGIVGKGEVKKEETKKRKSRALEDGGDDEQLDKKKKRRKS